MLKKTLGLLAGLLLTLGSGVARADIIETFHVSGSFGTPSGASFDGTITVDVTNGLVLNPADLDVSGVPGLASSNFYNVIEQPDPVGTVTLLVTNGVAQTDVFSLTFTTTTGSLMGFTGGMIVPGGTFVATFVGGVIGTHLADSGTGAIVPAPEPATLALIGIGLASFGFSRRRKLN